MLITTSSIIFSLVIIEVLLSVDNALVNATIAENLPEPERVKAIRVGIILGAVFRVVALLLAAYIIQNEWIKILGGMYLIYLFVEHVGAELDSTGKIIKKAASYKRAIIEIALADIVFSLDNVISAVSFSNDLRIVILGVGIGVISMLFITPLLSKLIHKYNSLATAAYIIVGLIGVLLVIETITGIHIPEVSKFAGIIAIIIFSVYYDTNSRLRRLSQPSLKRAALIVGIPFDIYHFVVSTVKKILAK